MGRHDESDGAPAAATDASAKFGRSSDALKTLRRQAERAADLAVQLQRLPLQLAGEIVRNHDAVVHEDVSSVLRSTSIREVGSGLRYSALEGAGIRTVADAIGVSQQRLLAIHGVGESTAIAVLDGVRQFVSAAERRVHVLPDPDRPRQGDTPLLQSLAAFDDYRRNVAPEVPAIVREAQQLTAAAEEVRSQHGWFGRLFSKEKRAGAVQDAAALSARLDAFVQRTGATTTRVTRDRPGPNSVWRTYSQNGAGFVAALEQAQTTWVAQGPSGVRSPRRGRPARRGLEGRPGLGPPIGRPVPPPVAPVLLAPPGPDPFGGMPPELAATIEAFDLQAGPLTASLRRYQEFGARFLAAQERAVLGDDMGLGKTVQVLAYMCHLHTTGRQHFLVVAPNSVLVNWSREVTKHTRLTSYTVHGDERIVELARWKANGGVAITSYGTLSALIEHIDTLDLLVADEAHYAKNPEAQRTIAVREVARRARQVALLTGTAIENSLDEMGSLVTLVKPGLQRLVHTLMNEVLPDPVQTRHQLAQVYLRRTQRDVLTELPEMTEIIEWVTYEGADRLAYERARPELMLVRQAAALGAGTVDSAKFERLAELFENYRSEGRKVVVFSYFRKVLDLVSEVAGGCEQITGEVSAAKRQQMIDTFTNTDGFAVLACQIEAGGIGINLQAAQVVVLMEPQLKPSVERQAIARVHRMGQTRHVMVHRMVAKDTVEEWALQLMARKQLTFDTYADPSSLKDASVMAADGSMPAIERELQSMIEQERAAKG